jgi:hypothetical protein
MIGSTSAKPTSGASLLQLFKTKKTNGAGDSYTPPKCSSSFDPRSLFMNSPKRVPFNSSNSSEASSESGDH